MEELSPNSTENHRLLFSRWIKKTFSLYFTQSVAMISKAVNENCGLIEKSFPYSMLFNSKSLLSIYLDAKYMVSRANSVSSQLFDMIEERCPLICSKHFGAVSFR